MAVLSVGSGQQYTTISSAVAAARDGDTVQVQAGTYVNDFATISSRITLQGVGGMVEMVATVPPPDGKAILTVNTDATIDHFAFSGARVRDENGAGIRYQGGHLTITNSYFHDNEMGLLAASVPDGRIDIRNSEFAQNGRGDGYTHNLYVNNIAALTVTDSYFHDAIIGHNIKSRAQETTITGNRIFDLDGTGSYNVDLPNGGRAVIANNVIQQGPNTDNPSVIHFGGEGTAYAGSSLEISGNTVDNDLGSGAVLLLNQTGTTATVRDNAVQGLSAGQMASGPANVSGTTYLSGEPALDTSSPWGSAPVPPGMPSNPGTDPSTPPVGPTDPGTDPSTPPVSPVDPGTGTPASVTLGSGPDALVLKVSQDAWQGSAQYTVSVDGQQVGGVLTASALHGSGSSDTVTLNGDWSAGPHQVALNFLNDAYAGTPATDRNLYLDDATYNGAGVPGAARTLWDAGSSAFQVTDGETGAGQLTLRISQDAWEGDAQYTISVDGTVMGGVRTATALHGAQPAEDVAISGDWGTGPHRVTVDFLNDAYAGTPDTDRNLYVEGITYDSDGAPGGEVSVAGSSTTLYDAGARDFFFG